MSVTLFFDLYAWFAAAILGVARLAPIFFMLPFLNSGVLTGAPRQAVIVLVATGFWAYVGVPLPALDGGRLAFLAYNVITRRRVNMRVEAAVHTVGFLLLFGLLIMVTFRDVSRLFGG